MYRINQATGVVRRERSAWYIPSMGYRTATLALVLTLLSGCATVLQIPRPVVSPSVPPVHEGYSMLSLPVSVRLDAVEGLLNARVPTAFADRGHMEIPLNVVVKTSVGIDYDYRFDRGPVSFTVKGNIIHASVAFSGELRGAAAGLFQAQVAIDGDVRVDGPITLLEDWTLSSQFVVTAKVNHAELPIGFTAFGQRIGTSISVRDQLQGALDTAKRSIADALNGAIRAVRLKEAVQPYWYALASPILINRNPGAWLTVRPVAVAFSGLSSDGKTLRVGLGMVAQISASLGLKPPVSTLGPLPRLTKPPQRAAFSLWLPVSIQYAELARLASAQLREPIQAGTTRVTVKQVQLWSSGGLLFVGLNVTTAQPNIRGWIYLQGRIGADPAGRVSVQDLDFTVDTKNGLVNTANTLLHSVFAQSLSDGLNRLLEEHAGPKAEEAAKAGLNSYLGNVRIAEGITLRAEVQGARVVGVYGSDAALELDTQFDGTASVVVETLAF